MTATLPRLSRSLSSAPPAAPITIVHLGLGNFHRAHQAWYTAHAGDAAAWGIAAFTGRRPDTALALAPQNGLYTLIVKDPGGDRLELLGAISAVHPAGDQAAYLDYLRRTEVALLTLTVTEAAYLADGAGGLRRTPEVEQDLDSLRRDPTVPVGTVPARLVAGLLARRAAAAGPITILSCDNLPDNGAVTAGVVTAFAAELDPSLLDWIGDHVDFASSMVDRITPATTVADRELVQRQERYDDAAPVATEPFHEWIMSGSFPAGRPRWEDAGAQIVADVTPFEQRKLWLLNGSHSLLAYAGSVRGHDSIDGAIADPACRGWVEAWWDEAARHLPLPAADIAAYRAALLDRYANPRIRHRLAQIAADGSTKIVVRFLPVLRAERATGRLPVGGATAIAGWIWHLRGRGAPVNDPGAAAYLAVVDADDQSAVQAVLELLDPGLGGDGELVALVVERLAVVAEQVVAEQGKVG